MLFRNNLPLAASEAENGWYFVEVLKPAPQAEHLILIHDGRIYDCLTMFPSRADYVIKGPVPTIGETESMCEAASEVTL